MTYPTLPDKHLDASTYPASAFLDALRGNGWSSGPVPDSLLLTYARFELYLATRPDLYTPNHLLGTGPGRFYLVNGTDHRVGINCLGIGAPAVVSQMELQAELGVQRFVSIGTAGGFDPEMTPGDIVLVDRAVRDEGTSYHYLAPDEPAVPDAALTAALGAALTDAGLPHRTGATLTTDAPHRTVARDVERSRETGVLTVEMEASAIFAAGAALGVPTACALVVDGVAAADPTAGWNLDLPTAAQRLQAVFAASIDLLATR